VGRRPLLEQAVAALDDPGATGILLHGEAGVGKTRLANEIAAVAEDRGRRVARAVASRSATDLPLGALAHLLPELAGTDAVGIFDGARSALRDLREGDRPVVLFVDDAQLLDASSATLVAQLVVAGEVFLLATIRTGERVPDVVSALWRDHGVVRLDLENLPRQNVETLLHLSLGGPIEGSALRSLWETSRGNLLYLHELVLAADGRGDLVEEDGVWQLRHPLASSPRLTELIGSRLEALEGRPRRVVDLLALCEPVSLTDAETMATSEELEELERAGLITVTFDGRRAEVRLSHPLHGEVLRAMMPVTRQRALLHEQIDRVETAGSLRREDAARVAAWRLDADGTADPELLVRGAALARQAHDFDEVARLAGAAAEGGSPRAGLLLGEALYELGRFDEADRALTAAADTAFADATDDELVVQITVIRTKNLFWGLLDIDRSLEVDRHARQIVASPDGLEALLVDEAALHMFSGHPDEALALLDAGPATDDPWNRVIRAIPLAPALSAAGRTGAAIAVAEAAFEEHAALGDQLAIAHPGTHIVNQVFALTDAGRLEEAEQLAAAGYDITVADRSLIAQIWFALNLGRIALVAGRPATARRWAREGVAVARSTGFVGPLHLALSGVAASSAALGDADAARRAVDELDALPGFGFLEPEQAIGRAWTLVVEGDVAGARTTLEAAADAAAATGHVVAESWLRHDLARLGAADRQVDRLDELAAGSDSALIAVRARHARAAATADAAALSDAVDELESIGLLLVAAEAANDASDAWKKKGEPRRAAAMSERSATLLARCEGAATPGTVRTDAVVPLSKREREVALLASQNVPSKEIAEQLFLSVRTVNNHLQRVYTKLGVTSRGELGQALARRADEEGTGAP
jgi:DNA-binding CsgD family transcriptional regulator